MYESFSSRCKAYEDCCGTECCVRALAVQKIWYFWWVTFFKLQLYCFCFLWNYIQNVLSLENELEHPSIFQTRPPYSALNCISSDFLLTLMVCRLLLIIAILCCCSTGYFIRRRVHSYPPPDRPEFTVAFSRNPTIASGNISISTFSPHFTMLCFI